jgi:NADH dehydrogenase
MRSNSVCVLGGTGFLGTRLVSRLIKEGRRVTVLTRDREQHKHMLVLPGLALEVCDVYDPAQLAERFRGQDAVVNLIGILNERGFGGGGFRRAHTELTRGALQAARSAGVTRFLQISALNAAIDAPSHYLRSKGEAERLIRETAGRPAWTILQPSVIFGPGDSFLNRFAALLAVMPLVFPLAKPNARFQPVFVDDVVQAMITCLARSDTAGRTYELGGPRQYSLREIVTWLGALTGHRRQVIGLTDAVARLQAMIMDFVPGRPFSTDNYRSLSVDSVCKSDGFAALGILPQSMESAAASYLGAFEGNARLSRNRAAAGRSGHRDANAHSGPGGGP